MRTVLLPPGVSPIAVNKHININTTLTDKHALTIRYKKPLAPVFECQAITVALIKPQLRTYFTLVRTNASIRDGAKNSSHTRLYVFFSLPSPCFTVGYQRVPQECAFYLPHPFYLQSDSSSPAKKQT
jgi:hypothetical protein